MQKMGAFKPTAAIAGCLLLESEFEPVQRLAWSKAAGDTRFQCPLRDVSPGPAVPFGPEAIHLVAPKTFSGQIES